MKKIILLVVCGMMLASCAIFGGKKGEGYVAGKSFVDDEALRSYLDGRDWTFEVDNIFGRYVPSTFNPHGYGLQVKGDSVLCYLPFFGRSYRASMMGEGPMTFESKMSRYSVSPNSKGGVNVRIEAHNRDRNGVTLNFLIYPNGAVSLNMTSDHTEGLIYHGHLKE